MSSTTTEIKKLSHTLSNGAQVEVVVTNGKGLRNTLRCKKDGKVYLVVGRTSSLKLALCMLQKYDSWIIKTMQNVILREQKHLAESNPIQNSTAIICGKQFKICVVPATKDNVSLNDNIITISTHIQTEAHINTLFLKFRDSVALGIYRRLCDQYIAMCGIVLPAPPQLVIKKVSSYWGKCFFTKNKIFISDRLILCPMPCIEYLILHEVVHFKEHNHQAGFHNTLAKYMPDYQKRSALLRTFR